MNSDSRPNIPGQSIDPGAQPRAARESTAGELRARRAALVYSALLGTLVE